MKRDRLFSAFSDIDDAYIEEARPKKMKTTKAKWIRLGALAATLTLLLAWLFVPFTYNPGATVKKYEGSEYYPVITKLNTYLSAPPRYQNNFDKIFSNLVSCSKNDMMAPGDAPEFSPDMDMNGSGNMPEGSYEEVTDNQVAGVIEADLIKRTTTHFFYLDGLSIKVYSIAGEASELVHTFEIPRPENAKYIYSDNLEFYLSTDATRLTVIYPYNDKNYESVYDIISLNVENPLGITEQNRTTVTGAYTSSRLVNGTLLVVGEYYVHYKPDYDKEETFLPQYNTGDGFESVPMENIIAPDKVNSRRYTVVTKYDESTLTLKDTLAVLSYSDVLYVSNSSIYLTRGYTENITSNSQEFSVSKSEILRIDYTGETFVEKGSATVDGTFLNQYSLDEYEGILRAVTTTTKNRVYNNNWQSGVALEPDFLSFGTSASLYLINIENMQTINSVVDFAPIGESVRSVRFDGTNAYVCTAVQNTDPVFFFDLSNTENITYKDTGTITGFSTSLIQLGDGFLLGIGQGEAWDTVKVEIYEESENGVVSVAKYEVEHAGYYATEYKSYLIDRKNGLFGFSYTDYKYQDSYGKYENTFYVVLHFDGYHLTELTKVTLPGGNTSRAVHIDDYIYFFGDNTFVVDNITD